MASNEGASGCDAYSQNVSASLDASLGTQVRSGEGDEGAGEIVEGEGLV